ncbi:hypothetical protein ACFL6L_01770 [candidate division KSB1 bacterium]
MNRLVYLFILFTMVFMFACGNNPAEPDENTELVAQLNAVETELDAVTLEDPDDSQKDRGERIRSLRQMIGRIDNMIKRMTRIVSRYPDEDAQKLIRQANRHKNAAVEAYGNEEYRKAVFHAKEARTKLREATKILREKYKGRRRK